MWLQQIAQSSELETLWSPLNLQLSITPLFTLWGFTHFNLLYSAGPDHWNGVRSCCIPLRFSRGQRGSGASPLIQDGSSPRGSDRLTWLAAMIDTLGLLWPLWLTSMSSLLPLVINFGLKCRSGNSGAAAGLLNHHFCVLRNNVCYKGFKVTEYLCAQRPRTNNMSFPILCPRVKWPITGKWNPKDAKTRPDLKQGPWGTRDPETYEPPLSCP